MNLVSRREKEIDYHFIDSAYFAKSIVDISGTWVDVGSGGGFPGLCAAILLPEHKFTLFEVIDRKFAFLNHIKNITGTTLQIRNERMEKSMDTSWDNAVCRALMAKNEWLDLMSDNAENLWFLASEDQLDEKQNWEIVSNWNLKNHGRRFLIKHNRT